MATDKRLAQQDNKNKAPKAKKGDDTEKDKHAGPLKKQLKDMGVEGKKAWYKQQKETPRNDETFADSKGFIEQSRTKDTTNDEVNGYVTFADRADKQSKLERASGEASVREPWVAEIAKPTSLVIECRGMQLFGMFQGVVFKKREEVSLKTGIKQAQMLGFQDDLGEIEKQAEVAIVKFQRSINAAHESLRVDGVQNLLRPADLKQHENFMHGMVEGDRLESGGVGSNGGAHESGSGGRCVAASGQVG